MRSLTVKVRDNREMEAARSYAATLRIEAGRINVSFSWWQSGMECGPVECKEVATWTYRFLREVHHRGAGHFKGSVPFDQTIKAELEAAINRRLRRLQPCRACSSWVAVGRPCRVCTRGES